MDKKQNLTASNPETVTISRAEYEKFQAQSKRISELESRVDVLMEALRLARHSSARPPKRARNPSWSS